ncbi:MAG: ArsR/SmtB family transcription factor [Spirochaetia bacterium]
MTKFKVRFGLSSIVKIGKAIDHPLRVRALAALRDRELCVCELVELFGLAPSTVSKHMSLIADAGLVNRRRDGKWTYYSIPQDPPPPIAGAIDMVMSLAAEDEAVAADRRKIENLKCRGEDCSE